MPFSLYPLGRTRLFPSGREWSERSRTKPIFPFPVEERLSRGGWGIDRGRLSPYNGPRILVRKGGGERREEKGAGWSKALGLLEPFGIEKLERR
jgi:hypothetical protein